ncbi:DUF262 domain-containing protein [Prevotella sp. 10(H)]|uniref:DUF262 domain-containing protein n=1 Tax=Prevotella sp. 10(H) TaxID=1158294 RepID=UPI00069099B3|nr:DUF262 domain-containing protein [Prevotella sp. 10(H)]
MNTKEYTFQSLFGSSFSLEETEIMLSKIEIPIIQRDYAQGRTNNEVERIRNRFLDALFTSITEDKHITLDFVYGDVSEKIENKEEMYVLTPLDGQQRLTTLFLLHWYIAKKEDIDREEYKFLNHFSYATRFSSRDFCQELVKFSPDFINDEISESIRDQAWYPYEWKNDPTIQSMLVMIDAIHQKFKNQPNLWESLVARKNITFYFLPLTEMGLTDDLYIKMNSRGKPLTPFEHFKAEFEEIIKQQSEELSAEINHKFDIEWTDMLFPFRGDNNIIDDEFMRYFHFISDILCYKSEINIEKDEFKLANLLYNKNNENAQYNIQYLKNSFDCWCRINITDFFDKFFSKSVYEYDKVKLYQDDVNIFRECCDNYGEYSGRNRKFPLSKILLLYSIITYLQNRDKITEDQFKRRIRIIRNLIWNSLGDEIRDIRMKALLHESETIILTGEIPIHERGDLGYNVRQKEEERSKIEWLKANSHMKDELFHLEDHNLLRGCIAIVGLDNHINFRKFRLLFDNCNKDLINTTLLSIGDYSQFISWRWQIGARYNDSVWIDLFHPTKQRQGFEQTSKILNILLYKFDEHNLNNDNLTEFVQEYINSSDTPKDWRYYLIKYEQMRQGNFGMYYWRNWKDMSAKSYEAIMMNTEKSIGGRNWNIFLYTLFHLPEFAEKLTLGDYSYQGDLLKIINTDILIDCSDNRYTVSQNDIKTEYPIMQSNNIDIEDRIEKGKQIINDLLAG